MQSVTRRLRVVVTAAAATMLAAGVLSSAALAAPASPRTAIAGTHPAWAVASARMSQQAVTTGTVTARVYLAGQDPAGLAAYAMAVATPGNSVYHHYLTPAQVMATYGATAAQISAVESWLTGAGLTVGTVDDAIGGYVEVTGSVQAAAQAFGVTFGMYRGPDKKADRAPTAAATAPAAVASAVSSVSGLDTATHNATPGDTLPPPDPNYWIAPPCSQYYAQKIAFNEPSAYGIKQPWTNCGYTPRQIRGAYHVAQSGMTGKGQSVAIVDAYASPTMLADANEYAKVTGDKPFDAGQYTQDLASVFTQTAPDECDAAGWYGEETLDVEAVHGMAPDAHVTYVGAASCTDVDLLAAVALIVDNHLASIVTDSWGEPFDTATLISTYDEVFQAGAAEGIGFFFSSGDSGYESPDEDPGLGHDPGRLPGLQPVRHRGRRHQPGHRPVQQLRVRDLVGDSDRPAGRQRQVLAVHAARAVPGLLRRLQRRRREHRLAQPSYQAGVVPNRLATALPDGTTARADAGGTRRVGPGRPEYRVPGG